MVLTLTKLSERQGPCEVSERRSYGGGDPSPRASSARIRFPCALTISDKSRTDWVRSSTSTSLCVDVARFVRGWLAITPLQNLHRMTPQSVTLQLELIKSSSNETGHMVVCDCLEHLLLHLSNNDFANSNTRATAYTESDDTPAEKPPWKRICVCDFVITA